MDKKSILACFLGLSFLTGCASIVNGPYQTVSVSTTPEKGAKCLLKNDKGHWDLAQTPGKVRLHRSALDLEVQCEKQGYSSSNLKVNPKLEPVVLGNVLLGGIVGTVIDSANGAAYKYPETINISLEERKKTLLSKKEVKKTTVKKMALSPSQKKIA